MVALNAYLLHNCICLCLHVMLHYIYGVPGCEHVHVTMYMKPIDHIRDSYDCPIIYMIYMQYVH